MSDLDLRLLGAPEVRLDGRPVSIGRRKDLALLAYLAVTGERHSRDFVAELFWPGLEQSRSRTALRKAIYRLRRRLSRWLETDRDSLLLRDGYELDVARLQRLVSTGLLRESDVQEALALYRGDLLAGFTLPDCPEFDRWQFSTADRTRAELVRSLAQRVDQYLDEGRYAEGIAAGRRLVAIDPLVESAHRALMRGYAGVGERAAALRQYESCVRLLDEELAVPPEPQTTALYHQLREAVATPATPATAVDHLVAPSWIDPRAAPMVGRTAERDRIARALEQAAAGHGGLLLVSGEPGIGKSRLLQEAVGVARRAGLHSIWVTCYRVEQEVPYQPVAELVDQVLAGWPVEVFRALPPAALTALASLVPEVASADGAPPPPIGADGSYQARLFRSVLRLLVGLAPPRGLLVVLDDLHWADRATLQCVHYLARHLVRERLVVIGSYRPGAATGVRELIDGLEREVNPSILRLAPLSAAEVAELTRQLAPGASGDWEPWLFAETEGNPFYLQAIVASLPNDLLAHGVPRSGARTTAGLPESLVRAIRDRLRGLTATERQVVAVAAVVGRRLHFDLLRSVVGVSALALLDAIEMLTARRILREADGGTYDFAHDKIREVVYHDLTPTRRRHLHGKVATALEERALGGESELSSMLASHFERAGEGVRARHHYARAAARARRLFALPEAERDYTRALKIVSDGRDAAVGTERLRLLTDRGRVRALLGDFAGAERDLHDALGLAERLEAPGARREVLIRLGMLYRRSDRFARAISFLERALAAAEEDGDEQAAADILFHLGTVVWSQGDNRAATGFHSRALAIVERLGLTNRIAMHAYHGRGEAYLLEGRQPDAAAAFARSLELARVIGDRAYEAENLMMLGASYASITGSGELAPAIERLETARRLCLEYQLDWHLLPTLSVLAAAHAASGAFQQGLTLAQQAISRARVGANERYLAVALMYYGRILLDLDMFDEAVQIQTEAIRIAERVGAGHPLLRARSFRALALVRGGELSVGHELEALLAEARRTLRGDAAIACLDALAEGAARSGNTGTALRFATELLTLGLERGLRYAASLGRLRRGEANRLAGDLGDAQTALRTALDEAESLGNVRLQWDAHAALARLYRTWPKPDRAATHQSRVDAIVGRIARDLTDPAYRRGLPPH